MLRGFSAGVGSRWWFGGSRPQRGQVVQIPEGAKPEPARKRSVGAPPRRLPEAIALPEETKPGPEDVERVLRAVALEAAAQLCAGHGRGAEAQVLASAEAFPRWLKA